MHDKLIEIVFWLKVEYTKVFAPNTAICAFGIFASKNDDGSWRFSGSNRAAICCEEYYLKQLGPSFYTKYKNKPLNTVAVESLIAKQGSKFKNLNECLELIRRTDTTEYIDLNVVTIGQVGSVLYQACPFELPSGSLCLKKVVQNADRSLRCGNDHHPEGVRLRWMLGMQVKDVSDGSLHVFTFPHDTAQELFKTLTIKQFAELSERGKIEALDALNNRHLKVLVQVKKANLKNAHSFSSLINLTVIKVEELEHVQ